MDDFTTDKLITFIIPSRNLKNLSAQFDHFEKNTFDHKSIEFLIKLDEDQEGVESFIQEEVNKHSFSIKYIITPRLGGTFSLWIGIEQLFSMASKNSYFIQVLSDEPYFLTHHWDNILRKYIHFYPDDVFRLRLSSVKFTNYASHYECAFRCDSFPIYTRRWLELTEGIGDCWGSDAYQQCVAYHLGLGPKGYVNFYREGSLNRDIPIIDIEMGGLEFGVGVDIESQQVRHIRNLQEWRRLSSFKMQERFSYLARRIYCYIWANENYKKPFILERDHNRKTVMVVSENNTIIFEASYKLQPLLIHLQNLLRDMKTHYYIKTIPWLKPITNILRRIIRVLKKFTLSFFIKYSAHINLFIKKANRTAGKSYPLLTIFCKKILSIFPLNRKLKNWLNNSDNKSSVKNLAKQRKIKTLQKNELLRYRPPDIDLLFKKKKKMPPNVNPLTEKDIVFGHQTVNYIQEQRLSYRFQKFIPVCHISKKPLSTLSQAG
jgi:hypothetical protein